MLTVENLKKQYRSFEGRPGGGVLGVSFALREGELFTLLGPSGCGKTTTLRAIAGLEIPDEGRIRIGARAVFDAAAGVNVALHDRAIGMVFQSYAIWPHMTVFENAAYPLRVSRERRYAEREIGARVMPVLEKLGLGELAKRPATQLSGGQQQRLALARALTREPRLLLLDEPLSNLDAQLREQMRVELKRLQQETGVTTVYVTHDQAEALAISDRIAVMNNGVIAQVGAPQDIYARPQSQFVASFIGRTNLIPGTMMTDGAANGTGVARTAFGEVRCFLPQAVKAGQRVSLVVRPEHIAMGTREGANNVHGRVSRETYLGEIVEYAVAAEGGEILVRAIAAMKNAAGNEVVLTFSAEHTIAL